MNKTQIKRFFLVSQMALVLFVLNGCNMIKSNNKSISNQSTPQELARKLHRTCVNGNLKEYEECFIDQKGKYRQLIEISGKYQSLAYEMLKKVKENYPEEEYERFQRVEFVDGPFYVIKSPPISTEWLDQLKFEYPSKNTAEYSDGFILRKLSKIGNTWYVDMDLYDPPVNTTYSIDFGRRAMKAIEKALPLVGQEGITVTDLKREMGKITENVEK